MLKLLVDTGADITASDQCGCTAWYEAYIRYFDVWRIKKKLQRNILSGRNRYRCISLFVID